MKRLLFCMALLCSANAYSQDLKYDLNGDGKEDVSDVTFLTDYLLNKGKESESETEEHEYVDLGLPSGTLWATCNVGAEKPEHWGLFFAWGDTEGFSFSHVFSWDNYKWCDGSSSTLTKYCTISSYGIVDGLEVLEASDDAATANWGNSWRMPTDAEMTELRTNCTWVWTCQNNMNGYKITGANENSIFLPAASIGDYSFYWSSTINKDNPSIAYLISFASGYIGRRNVTRYSGFSVRPVRR